MRDPLTRGWVGQQPELLGPDSTLPVSRAGSTARAWDTPGMLRHLPLLASAACPARPLGIPPLHPCQGDRGRRGSSAWPRDGGCTGSQHLFGRAATGSGPTTPSPHSRYPPQHQWLQRPAASRGSSIPVSIICSSLPGFLCQQGGSAQSLCPGAIGGGCLPGKAPAFPEGRGTGQLQWLPATCALGTAPQLDLHLPCLLLHGN